MSWKNTEKNDVVDTNLLLDWLLGRDMKRVGLIEKLLRSQKRLVVHDLVIAEVVFALQKYYGFRRSVIVQSLTRILDESRWQLNRTVLLGTVLVYRDHPSLSFVDCYLSQAAEAWNTTLWTFDKKLATQSGGRARVLK